jgi:hypothetical protein
MDENLEPCTPETPDQGLGISDAGFVFTTCDSPVDHRELLFKFLVVGEFGVGKICDFILLQADSYSVSKICLINVVRDRRAKMHILSIIVA